MKRRFCLLFLVCLTPWWAYTQNTLIINEFMASNVACLADEDGDYSDWIEIYNPTNNEISLDGWSLSANPSKPRQWRFPDIQLGGGEYLVVFASDKKREVAGEELHTNFKLSASGEYLALVSPQGEKTTVFDPYEALNEDVSCGYLDGYLYCFTQATPNAANNLSGGIQLPRPKMSVSHGFYEKAFDLSITCDVPEVKIYYTTDGSEPSVGNGKLYQTAISIEKTTIIRAIAISENKRYTTGKIATQSYLFLDDIVKQSNSPEGYPDTWGPYATISGTTIADYEMDPEMTSDPAFVETLKEGLLSLPALSLVTDKDNLFNHENDATTGGIYIYTDPPTGYTKTSVADPGTKWVRAASFEMFDDKDSISMQEDCGVRLHGGHSRVPEKSPKHSFRLVFKPEYGASKLNYPMFGEDGAEKLDNIVLRAGFCNTWIHANVVERNKATYTRDTWTKATHKKMGHPASNFIYTHLYINGIYWGLYNPTERIDNSWCESYFGGNKEDYDVIKVEDNPQTILAGDGNMEAWNELFKLAAGASDESVYQKIQGKNADGSVNSDYPAYIDMVNFIDYMIINMYGGNTDWDRHNWLAVRNRVDPGSGFKFVCWDSEHVLKTLDGDVGYGEKRDGCPSILFGYFMKNANFCRLFADRVQRHCYQNGALTPMVAAQTWQGLSDQIALALNDESARWGDYRRDVHQWNTGPFELYTKATHYDPVQKEMLETILPQRRDVFIKQVRTLGLFPSIDAPLFRLNDQEIQTDTFALHDTVHITAAKGTIYYTLDQNDPVTWKSDGSGEISASAKIFTEDILLEDSSICIKARALSNQTWSALSELALSIPAPEVIIPEIEDTLPTPPAPVETTFLTNYMQVAPNPVYDVFTIHYELAEAAEVCIEVFDVHGHRIAMLENGWQGGGSHRMEVDASSWSAGVYHGRLLYHQRNGKDSIEKFKIIKL